MEFDITGIITVILAVSSFLSPIFVAIINNRHHTKIRKMELEHDEYIRLLDLQQHLELEQINVYYTDKKNAFSEFAHAAGLYSIGRQDSAAYDNIQAAIHKAMLFCNSENYELLSDFLEFADKILGEGYSLDKRNKYSTLLNAVAASLNKELMSTKPVIQCKPSKS